MSFVYSTRTFNAHFVWIDRRSAVHRAERAARLPMKSIRKTSVDRFANIIVNRRQFSKPICRNVCVIAVTAQCYFHSNWLFMLIMRKAIESSKWTIYIIISDKVCAIYLLDWSIECFAHYDFCFASEKTYGTVDVRFCRRVCEKFGRQSTFLYR